MEVINKSTIENEDNLEKILVKFKNFNGMKKMKILFNK